MNEEIAAIARKAAGAVDHERVQSRIVELARFGGRTDGGVARETLSSADRAARRFLVEQARALGCDVAVDDCGNLFFRRPGTQALPPVLTGSHADTQPVGGKLDGAYGVVGGLEVIAALNDAGIRTRRPVEVVAWTNEEGCRFGPGAMGSSAFVGAADLMEYRKSTDGQGVTFGEALDEALADMPDVPRCHMGTPLSAYVELHIEQGPVLEQAGLPLGVVTGIQGVRWYRVTCVGEAGHAGTTPMDRRADAIVASTGMVQRLNEIAAQVHPALRVTMGSWIVKPNSINTIAGNVVFTVDARCPDDAALDRFEEMLNQTVTAWPWRGETTLDRFFCKAPTVFHASVLDVVAQACDDVSRQAGFDAAVRLSSGAFHDAMYLAQHCPSAMIFVPSIAGISHNAAEATAPEPLTLGVRALAHAVAALAL